MYTLLLDPFPFFRFNHRARICIQQAPTLFLPEQYRQTYACRHSNLHKIYAYLAADATFLLFTHRNTKHMQNVFIPCC